MLGNLADTYSWQPSPVSPVAAVHPRFQLMRDWIEAQIQLECVVSDFKWACSRYQNLCQELDFLLNRHPLEQLQYLEPERDRECQEITAVIDEISRLSLTQLKLERVIAAIQALLFFNGTALPST
ncbi:hypothetical protein [Lyngbya sp. CCY1209]|uniref:hypothetical protein n=1 Tax=Lyngbya sp. CCY1209 TaxID=2886103 RepID=UPI002D2115D7|nr:hypothetical protein [Lyngbya sp. CCY1209]MEB3883522.1 hypothetical protein [Lyngbya sp. CCY1209]